VGVVAWQAQPEGGGEGLGQDAEHDVEVDVEVDGAGQNVGAEGLDDLGQPLLDGRPAGVALDQRLGFDGGALVMRTVGASRPRPVMASWRTVPG
jgi:hypothetical protein